MGGSPPRPPPRLQCHCFRVCLTKIRDISRALSQTYHQPAVSVSYTLPVSLTMDDKKSFLDVRPTATQIHQYKCFISHRPAMLSANRSSIWHAPLALQQRTVANLDEVPQKKKKKIPHIGPLRGSSFPADLCKVQTSTKAVLRVNRATTSSSWVSVWNKAAKLLYTHTVDAVICQQVTRLLRLQSAASLLHGTHYCPLINFSVKGQNPLHHFPRSKSVTSWQLPRLYEEVTGKLV